MTTSGGFTSYCADYQLSDFRLSFDLSNKLRIALSPSCDPYPVVAIVQQGHRESDSLDEI